jgi:hypothetical protein
MSNEKDLFTKQTHLFIIRSIASFSRPMRVSTLAAMLVSLYEITCSVLTTISHAFSRLRKRPHRRNLY